MENNSCLITVGCLPQDLLDSLKPYCSTIDVWKEKEHISKTELMKRIKGKTCLICSGVDEIDLDVLNAAGDKLLVIATLSVGYDNIDINECRKRSIKVGNTPHVLSDAVADLTIALLLATSRRLFEANQALKKGEWVKGFSLSWMMGKSLKDSVVGIVGMGNIGLSVLARLKPFKIRQFLYTANSRKPKAEELGAVLVNFKQLLQTSDFVIVCCSLNDTTRHLFNADAFKLMKNSSIFINTSRGGVVDQAALVDALASRRIKAAGLDVMTPEPIPLNDPLLSLDNVVLIPHIGSSEYNTRLEMARLSVANVIAGLEGSKLPAAVID